MFEETIEGSGTLNTTKYCGDLNQTEIMNAFQEDAFIIAEHDSHP